MVGHAATWPSTDGSATAADPGMTSAHSSGKLDPGDPRTLAFGTDKGRWLQEQLREQAANGTANPYAGASNPYRQQRQY